MSKIGKTSALILTLIIAMSCVTLLTVKPVNAQSIPTPSVPQFTVTFINASYTMKTTNAQTGQSQTQLINNNSIKITISNQPLSYSNNGLTYQIYFNIRYKLHFSNTDNWTEVYPLENLTTSPANANGIFTYAWYVSAYSPVQSNSTSTIINFQVVPTAVYQATRDALYGIPIDSQLDVQVEVLVGHNSTYWYIQHPSFPTKGGLYEPAIAFDSASGWGNSQTVTIEGSPKPTSSPAVPILFWLIIVALLLFVFAVAVIVRHRKTTNSSQ